MVAGFAVIVIDCRRLHIFGIIKPRFFKTQKESAALSIAAKLPTAVPKRVDLTISKTTKIRSDKDLTTSVV